jgi:threonine aldolase
MKTTGTNSSNAFFILTLRYQSDPKRRDRCHRGAHNELLTDNALQITTQTMTKIMRTSAMQAAITVMEIERAIATKDHTGEDNANTPPRRGEPLPRTNNNSRSSIRPPPCSIQYKAVAQR